MKSNLLRFGLVLVSMGWLTAQADTVDRGGSTIQSYDGNLKLTCNPNWGGACVSIQWRGTEFVNCWDAGRECQVASYVGYNGNNYTPWTDYGTTLSNGSNGVEVAQAMNVPSGKTPNPTECGDEQYDRLSYPSPTDWWSAGGSTIQNYTRSREFTWRSFFNPSVDDRGHIYAAINSSNNIVKKSVWIPGSSYGLTNVVKFEGWCKAPTQGDLHFEVPALYLQPAYKYFVGYDVTTSTETVITNGMNYNPALGGLIAYDGNRNDRCIALYGANGLNSNWKFGPAGVFADCNKIRANSPWLSNIAPGTVVYGYCFIIVGDNIAHVENTMKALQAKGWK